MRVRGVRCDDFCNKQMLLLERPSALSFEKQTVVASGPGQKASNKIHLKSYTWQNLLTSINVVVTCLTVLNW
jgi:hypothetical protein